MNRALREIYTGDEFHSRTSPAREIDKRLTELSRLYLLRFKTMRESTFAEVQKITDQINAIKQEISQL